VNKAPYDGRREAARIEANTVADRERQSRRDAEARVAMQRRKYAVDVMTNDQMRAMLYYLAVNDQEAFDRARFGAL
jgi:hypothetical protein